MSMENLQVQRMLTVNDQSLGIGPYPLAYGELRVLALISHTAHQDGILLGTQFMTEHLSKRRRYGDGLTIIINKAISRLCPF